MCPTFKLHYMRKKLILALLFFLTIDNQLSAQDEVQDDFDQKMEWFDDAKLGIFVHWGIYSVKGISESWAFFNNYINHENYLKQLDGFTGDNYDPQAWVQLIKDAGAKYAVITSKHHDGISLWDTQAPEAITISGSTPARRDVLTPFIQEMKRAGLRTGIYFSLPDWSHPYYDVHTRSKKRYNVQDDPERWKNYVDYYQLQLSELSTRYNPDLLWFDGDWEHSSADWRAAETLGLLKRYNPEIVINSRLNEYGDYETPEQGVPVAKPVSRYWELCYTMNDSWGFQPFDTNYKSPNMIIRTLLDCISMGGNLLLGIGPKADGIIPREQVQILQELQRWTSKYGDAVYGTRSGLDKKYCIEKSAFAKNGKRLFIYLDAVKQSVHLKGLKSRPATVKILGDSTDLNYSFDDDDLIVQLPKDAFDPTVTVLVLDFDKKPVFSISKTNKGTSLSDLLLADNPHQLIVELAKSTDLGDNLLAGKITVEGDFLDSALVFKSEESKKWISNNAEVLHNALEGLPDGHYAGYSALSADRQTLYLFVDGAPTGPVALKGIKNNIARVRIVGEGSMLSYKVFNKLYWSDIPGIAYIDIPSERLDKHMTVLAILLDGPIERYRENIGAIENNI